VHADISKLASSAPAAPRPKPASTMPPMDLKGGYFVPEWGVMPPKGAWVLEVIRDNKHIANVELIASHHVFGRNHTCETVCEHTSLSRFHAAVAHHISGAVYVIDLASSHGTFLSEQRLPKGVPTLLEEGCSIRLGGSTRRYRLKCKRPLSPVPVIDPNDEDSVVAYNTFFNKRRAFQGSAAGSAPSRSDHGSSISKRMARVSFGSDQDGKVLEETIGFSDGSGFAVGVGPKGVDRLSAASSEPVVGKFGALVSSTIVVPKPNQGTSGLATTPGRKPSNPGTAKHRNVGLWASSPKATALLHRATLPVVSLAIPSLGRSGSLYDDLPTDGSCTSSWAASPAEIEMDISNNDSDDEIDRRKKQKTGGIGTKVSKDRGDFLRKSTTVEDKLER